MKFGLIVSLVSLSLFACATEQQPPKKWDVKVSTAGETKVWVYKADGSRQCEPKSALLTPDDALAQLKKAGVLTYQSRAGNDGMMHTALCGSATGNTVEVEISRVDLEKATNLGFRPARKQN